MVTYYVEDYDGERNDDAVAAPEAKVVKAPAPKPAKTAAAKISTKAKG